MLDPVQAQHYAAPQIDAPEDVAPAFSFAEVKAIARRQGFVLTAFTLVGMAAGGAYLALVKPKFQATATILIDTRKYPDAIQSNLVARTTYDSSSAIDTQVEILKSRTLAQAVVDKLALWREPEFVKKGGGPRAMLTSYFKPASPLVTLDEEELRGRAIGYFLQHLSVKRVGGTFTIDISFESPYADHAAQVSNATATAFIEWQRNLHRTALNAAGEWLEDRIKDLREKSTAERQAVADYQSRNNVSDARGIASDEKRLNELNNQLEAARSQMTDAEAKLMHLEQIGGARGKAPSDLEIVSAVENAYSDPSRAAMHARYSDLKARYDQLSKILPPNHQALVDLRSQLEGAHIELVSELARVRQMMKDHKETAQVKVNELNAQINAALQESRAAAAAQAALKHLEINAQTYQNLYDTFLHRYAESIQGDGSPAAEATVLSAAEPPDVRNYKKSLIVFAALSALGMLGGGCVAFLRERINNPFWTARDVERELRLPCSDAVPRLTPAELKRATAEYLASIASKGDATSQGVPNCDPIGYYALVNPTSRFAESIRSIRIALNDGNWERSRRVVGITSALPDEGKTSIALAVATSAARAGIRTVLVDCDLRNPTLSRAWNKGERRRGLLDVVNQDLELSDALQYDAAAQLHFLASGSAHSRRSAADVMASGQLASLICNLRDEFDLVIVDLPPASPVNDVATTHGFIDNYVLVIKWGVTKAASVEYALRQRRQIQDRTVTTVLNMVNIKKMTQFGAYMQDYYLNNYEERGRA